MLTIREIAMEAITLWKNSNEFIKNTNAEYAFMTGSQWTPSQQQAIRSVLKIRLPN